MDKICKDCIKKEKCLKKISVELLGYAFNYCDEYEKVDSNSSTNSSKRVWIHKGKYRGAIVDIYKDEDRWYHINENGHKQYISRNKFRFTENIKVESDKSDSKPISQNSTKETVESLTTFSSRLLPNVKFNLIQSDSKNDEIYKFTARSECHPLELIYPYIIGYVYNKTNDLISCQWDLAGNMLTENNIYPVSEYNLKIVPEHMRWDSEKGELVQKVCSNPMCGGEWCGCENLAESDSKKFRQNLRDYNIGKSNYATKKIQPWDIWEEYKLDPWDADIVKRVLRDKEDEDEVLDYEKIKHICDKKIDMIKSRRSE